MIRLWLQALKTNRRRQFVESTERTGYTSPNAFAATSRRHHGVPPGRWREASGTVAQ
jgi:AraC-like DNA-binding protein